MLLSCQDLKKDGQIKAIEQLEQKRDSIDQIFSEIKSDSTTLVIANAVFLEEQLRRRYEFDTLNLELGKKINEYKMIIKQLPPVLDLMDTLRERLQEEEETLHNLKTDIEKAAGDKAKYDEYIAFEQQKIMEIETQLQNALAYRKRSLDAYGRLDLEMRTFSKNLEKKKE